MYDDVSAIPTTGCSVLTSDTSLSNYNGNVRKDFVFNGGKWYLYRTQTSNFNDYDVSSYNCIDVSSLYSYSVYTPFLYGVGFLLFFFVLMLVFKTIKGFLHGI